jgi:hypothetical protein
VENTSMGNLPPFAETVAELFQSTATLVWRTEATGHAVATFNVKSLVVDVDFEQQPHDGPWHVAFAVVRGDVHDQNNIALAFRLFNGVFQAVREFVESRKPEMLVFVAEDDDVASIFDTYLRRDRNTMEDLGYEMLGPYRVGRNSEWVLRRVNL